LPDKTSDTVDCDTPARRATSMLVTRLSDPSAMAHLSMRPGARGARGEVARPAATGFHEGHPRAGTI
jgi:hypothetical protein